METISNYLDSLFINIKETPETRQLKEDLLAHMEDRYQELLDEGKNEHEAIGTVISEFGTIDELLEEVDVKRNSAAEEDFADAEDQNFEYPDDPSQVLGLADFKAYLKTRKEAAVTIGSGVFIVLLALSPLILMDAMFGGATGIGVGLFFLLVAVAVGLFIYGGLSLSHARRELNDRFISRDVKEYALERKQEFSRSFTFCIILGVCLCIISLVPVAVTNGADFGAALMFPAIGCGVFLFIYGGLVKGTFDQFLKTDIFIDEDHIGPNALSRSQDKEYHRSKYLLNRVFWPLVVVFYFLVSFLTGLWGITWLIFVVASALEGLISSYFKNKNQVKKY